MTKAKRALPAKPKPVERAIRRKPRFIYALPDGTPMGKRLDLLAACAWKGVKYSTVSADRLRQPLLGFTRLHEGGTRLWMRAEVEEWLEVFDDEREAYIRGLLERDDPELRAYVYETLEKQDHGRPLSPTMKHLRLELLAQYRRVG